MLHAPPDDPGPVAMPGPRTLRSNRRRFLVVLASFLARGTILGERATLVQFQQGEPRCQVMESHQFRKCMSRSKLCLKSADIASPVRIQLRLPSRGWADNAWCSCAASSQGRAGFRSELPVATFAPERISRVSRPQRMIRRSISSFGGRRRPLAQRILGQMRVAGAFHVSNARIRVTSPK
jgi:hypothetical protein